MLARMLVLLFAIVVIGAGAGIAYFLLGESTPIQLTPLSSVTDPLAPMDPTDSTRQVVSVPQGATAADIGNDLQQRGLVRSGLIFRFAVEQAGVGGSLVAGDYELSRSMSTQEIIQVLARGQVKRGLVATIPEGWRSEQIADRLQATGFSSRDDFLQAVATPASVPAVTLLPDPQPPRLEGFLFPETYEVSQQVPGTRAADLMLRMFQQRLGSTIKSTDSKLSPYQVLILASIVEREAKVSSERATIASVYLNRLASGLPLQADPTVQYALATRDGPQAAAYNYWKTELSQADLQIDSPYNTYQNGGLPPGPICNPGEPSIRAVLQPATTDYVYFVATTDGSGRHLFARTLDEHNANVARVNGR